MHKHFMLINILGKIFFFFKRAWSLVQFNKKK